MDPTAHNSDLPKPPASSVPAEVEEAQLTLGAWLARNGPVLFLVLAGLVFLWSKFGAAGMGNILLVVLGIGLVIFIHELGHFAVAKWCDVHVQTFSIGFGPALPGCSFRRGETTYKLALIPLGGYVKMVGEGDEGGEDDEDPRSFKNKTVGQRMAIISAGVVMNVLLGGVCYIWAFSHGVHRIAPVIGVVEAGGPAWVKGVACGDVVAQVGDNSNPYFDDLRVRVMLSGEGETVPFIFRSPGKEPRTVSILPRKGRGESNPVIGVRWPTELRLLDARDADGHPAPVHRNSPAAAARAMDLKPGDRVVATTDPDHPEADTLKDLGEEGFAGLATRMRRLEGKPMTLKIRRKEGAVETVTAQPQGFAFDDEIVGSSVDPSEPFAVQEIPFDPRDPQERHRDTFEFLRRMKSQAGDPTVVRVQRKGGGYANVFVPPQFHRLIPGLRMEIGAITAIREGSAAEKQGVKVKDVLVKVSLADAEGKTLNFASHPSGSEQKLDPLRLPDALRAWAKGRKDVSVTLTVQRAQGNEEKKEVVLRGLEWDSTWFFDEAVPLGPNAPLPISELGMAYQIKATVEDVTPDSQAAQRGLSEGDTILAVNFVKPPKKPGDAESWFDKPLMDLRQKGEASPDPQPRWANAFFNIQRQEYSKIRLLVRHAPTGNEEEVELDLQEDLSWPMHNPISVRGLEVVATQDRIARAENLLEAIRMGGHDTMRTIGQIYLSLRSLVTGRVSASENLQGPIDIAVIAYRTAERDWSDFVLLIGIISVNLAVVNFLPIPVLDGGHMVFLTYEKLRGRPASETVRLAATWVGVVLLFSLMAFAIYLGVKRHMF